MPEATHQLAAIMFTDIVGYTALMGKDEQRAIKLLDKNLSIQKPLIEQHQGELLKEIGDGLLASFNSVIEAVKCAIEIQDKLKDDPELNIRVGIHLGDVLFRDGDVLGDGVNIASRIESLASSGEILVSEAVYNSIKNQEGIHTKFVKKETLKNVEKPVEIYKVSAEILEQYMTSDSTTSSSQFRSTKKKFFNKGIVGIGAIGFLIILVLAYFLYGSQNNEVLAKNVIDKSIAVLPFSNIKIDPETNYLGLAIADQIIGSLTYLEDIIVRPSGTIRKFENQTFDPITVADELNVNFIISGNYLMVGGVIRLNIELVDVIANQIIWREPIEVSFNNAFELQDIVAQKVVDGLNVRFSNKELNRIKKDIPGDPLAYEYYLRSISYPLTKEGDKLAFEMLKNSIQLDSTYAPVYVELGWRIYRLKLFYDENEPGEFHSIEYYYLKALSLNKELISALSRLSQFYTETGRIEKAIELNRINLEINPNNAQVLFSIGYSYRYAGMLDEAIENMEKAVALDPENKKFRSLGVSYYQAGKYQEAFEAFEIDSNSDYGMAWQGMSLFRQGKIEQAIEYFNNVINSAPTGTIRSWVQGVKAAIEGNIEEGLAVALENELRSSPDSEVLYFTGITYSMLGDIDGSVRMLRQAVESGYFVYPRLKTDSLLDPIRQEVEFKEIVEMAKKRHQSFIDKYF